LVQPGDLGIKTANLPAANKKIRDEVKELIDSYLKDAAEFSSMFEERTAVKGTEPDGLVKGPPCEGCWKSKKIAFLGVSLK
jgi:hypothetical protein